MKDKKTFGLFIKEKRIEKNYSQKDLAELLYVTESAVSKWERGVSYPDITLISNLCKVLDITEKELIESSDDFEYRKMKNNSESFNKIKKTLFWFFNILYLTALVTCFIVNLAVNHTLSWFFIVLGSILVAYSFCPTFTWTYYKYKRVIFLGSTFVSLFILFLICSIYSSNYWFMIATIGVLIGYFIIFYPVLFKKQKEYLDIEKYNKLRKLFLLTYITGIFILIVLLLVFIRFYTPYNLLLGFGITGGLYLIAFYFSIMWYFGIKSKTTRIMLLVLNSLLVVFFIISLVSSIHLHGTVEEKTLIIEEQFNKIEIDVETENIIVNYKDGNNIINYDESDSVYLDIIVENNTLYIKRIDNRTIFQKLFYFGKDEIELNISSTIIDSLIIKAETGDVTINKGITYDNVSINNSTGNIKFYSNVNDDLSLNTSTGNILIENCLLNGNVDLKVSTGNIKVTNTTCSSLDVESSTGNVKLINTIVEKDFRMEGSTGDLEFNAFDANNIYVTLSTGDVEGTILTSKFFICKSDTGDVDVPKTKDGGECIITVSTGDIDIRYK